MSELLFATDETQAPAVGEVDASAVQDSNPKLAGESSYGPDDMTCAICLEQIQLEDTAYVKGCEHAYCAKCILHWADLREDSTCPQCKKPFSRLLTYRMLDGTLNDFPTEESVCLLKRANWVQDQLKAAEKGKAVASSDAFYAVDAAEPVTDWQDYSNYYDEYDDDEEVEDFYFSSAAGRARIVLGNRRWGENGYVASGRQQARPVQRTPKATPGSSNKKGSAGKTAGCGKVKDTVDTKDIAVNKSDSAPANASSNSSAAVTASPASEAQDSVEHSRSAGHENARNSMTASSPIAMPTTPVAIQSSTRGSVGRRSSGFDIAGTSSDSLWGSSNSGGAWSAYERGKKAAGKQQGVAGSSSGNEGANSKAGRRARRNAKKAAADAKADVYAY